MTDGYRGYDALGKSEGIIHFGCWSHARRKFFEAKKVAGGKSEAIIVLHWIRRLFAIERIGRKVTASDLMQLRDKISRPTLWKIKDWLETNKEQVAPKSALGKAIRYTLNEWEKLERYVDHPNIRIDNNLVENAIRPFVIGRKNWMFSDSIQGAKSSAFFYSGRKMSNKC